VGGQAGSQEGSQPASQPGRQAGRHLDTPADCLVTTHSHCPLRSAALLLQVMDIARKNNLARVLRCSQIMGRSEKDDLSAAQIMYPVMQCADIFFLKVTSRAARAWV
jgi:hypothetical protein